MNISESEYKDNTLSVEKQVESGESSPATKDLENDLAQTPEDRQKGKNDETIAENRAEEIEGEIEDRKPLSGPDLKEADKPELTSQEDILYTDEKITPAQLALLNGPNSRQYPAEQEIGGTANGLSVPNFPSGESDRSGDIISKSRTIPITSRGTTDFDRITDTKLAEFFKKAKERHEKEERTEGLGWTEEWMARKILSGKDK